MSLDKVRRFERKNKGGSQTRRNKGSQTQRRKKGSQTQRRKKEDAIKKPNEVKTQTTQETSNKKKAREKKAEGEREVEVTTKKKETTTTETLRITRTSAQPDQSSDVVDGSAVSSVASSESAPAIHSSDVMSIELDAPTCIHSSDGNILNIILGPDLGCEAEKDEEAENDSENTEDKDENFKRAYRK